MQWLHDSILILLFNLALNTIKDLTQDAAILALLASLIGPLTTAEEAAVAAAAIPSAETAAEVLAAVSSADSEHMINPFH